MKLKYRHIATFLLVWGAIVLVRIALERDQLQEQLAEIQGPQTETATLADEDEGVADTQVALTSTHEPIPRAVPGWTASEWAAHIKEIAPARITLTEVVATDDHVTLVGEAKNTSDIAILMRAIDQANLGTTELRQAMRTGDISEFTLGVKVRPSPSMLAPGY